jgi:D-glycero-D-manno-heptose 1,7-bisphosphate phosphatase
MRGVTGFITAPMKAGGTNKMSVMPGEIMRHVIDGVGLWADLRCERPATAGPILFVDRDGVLIEDRGYVGSAQETRVYPDAAEAVAAACRLGYRVAIVTNQSGIARGLYDWTGFAAVQAVIDAALARAGTAVDAVFACAYHADGQAPYVIADHFWRKPNPGMILEGLRRLNGIAARSVMIGDKPGDIAAARGAGLGSAVYVARDTPAAASDADAVVRSFGEAVAWIARVRTESLSR